jgi:hypothetical protein
MAKRHYRIDSQLLTLSFFVAMPLAAFGAFIVVSIARGALQDSLGRNLEQRALQTRILVERYMGDQVFHVRLISLSPEVPEAILAATSASPAKREARRALPDGAPPPAVPPALRLTSTLAGLLRQTVRIAPSFRLLQVIGTDGHIVAASARTRRLTQADTVWYDRMAREESPAPYIGGLWRAPGGKEAFIEIVYPVWHPKTGQWIGAVRALVATSDLTGVLTPVRIARSEHALLIQGSDGLILASDESDGVLVDAYPGFSALQAALLTHRSYSLVPATRSTDRGTTPRIAPARLVGLSPVEQVPGVDWLVVVERDLAEAVAPVADITRYLWWHFIGAFASVFLLALYLSLRQATPVIEEELHLHEDHVPPSMHRRAGDDVTPPAAPEPAATGPKA